jgi:hypothetical protein
METGLHEDGIDDMIEKPLLGKVFFRMNFIFF